MPGFTTRADVLTEAFTNGKYETFEFQKLSTAPEVAGVLHSLWTAAGMPAQGANPAGTPGAAYDSDLTTQTAGAIWFPDRSTDQKHLYTMSCMANTACNLILYDRLVGVGSVTLVGTGSKTVNSAALTRYTGTDAVDNEVWLEVSVATTVSAPVVNLATYTSSDGSTGLAGGSVTFPAAATNVDTIMQMPLHETERGVRSVETINVGTAPNAGTVNVLIIRRLATIPLLANQWNRVNFLDHLLRLPRIYDNATLGLAFQATGTSQVTFAGNITAVYG